MGVTPGDHLSVAAHFSDDQLLVRVGRVVEPLPGGHEERHYSVLERHGHLQAAHELGRGACASAGYRGTGACRACERERGEGE